MKSNDDEYDPIEEIERIDRFYDGEEEGERPIEVLRARGVEIPDETSLDDAKLYERLWAILKAMAEIGIYVESTNHLSDRELYRYLVGHVLVEETILPGSPMGGWFYSPIGGCSEEDIEIYLRYYADEDERESFREDDRPLPPKETPPYDRDRLLPQFDPRASEDVQ
ncbi:MAG: hypothetical protein WBX15_03975 [Thermoanaerobaculia bacterium]